MLTAILIGLCGATAGVDLRHVDQPRSASLLDDEVPLEGLSRNDLVAQHALLEAHPPRIAGWVAMIVTGSLSLLGGSSMAILAAIGGTGDVSAMFILLVWLPGGIAVIGLAVMIIGAVGLAGAISQRHANGIRAAKIADALDRLDHPAPLPLPPQTRGDGPEPGLLLATF